MKREKTTEITPPARSRRRVLEVWDDELQPLTRTYRISGEQPPPLPGRSGRAMALVEFTFVVRDDELRPMTRAEWVQAPPKRVARRLAKLAS